MLSSLLALALTLSPTASVPSDVQAVVTANNQFALDLYNQMRSDNGNVFFSPYSISKTLAMVWRGAGSRTAEEMAGVLHFTLRQEKQHRAFLETRKLLNSGLQTPHRVQLQLSANLWGQRGSRFKPGFLKLLEECYGAGLKETDFREPEQARNIINAWADKQTNHKIQGLFQPGAINQNTRLVLASAIYFKGDWSHKFEKSQTVSQPFWSDSSRQAPVRMMNQTAKFGYFENGQVQCLQLPYQGNGQAMLVLLPKKRDGLENLEKGLTAEVLANWVSQLREQEVKVSLPKLTLTGDYSLSGMLQALGMKKAFISGEADFSGMDGGRESLFLSKVVHKAFVEVSEEGTEAAAATGAAMATLSLPVRSAIPEFRADHPFAFALCDVRTGMILFLGRMARP